MKSPNLQYLIVLEEETFHPDNGYVTEAARVERVILVFDTQSLRICALVLMNFL